MLVILKNRAFASFREIASSNLGSAAGSDDVVTAAAGLDLLSAVLRAS
jgi:hypothetical protein